MIQEGRGEDERQIPISGATRGRAPRAAGQPSIRDEGDGRAQGSRAWSRRVRVCNSRRRVCMRAPHRVGAYASRSVPHGEFLSRPIRSQSVRDRTLTTDPTPSRGPGSHWVAGRGRGNPCHHSLLSPILSGQHARSRADAERSGTDPRARRESLGWSSRAMSRSTPRVSGSGRF
jgi:hypothetical protein